MRQVAANLKIIFFLQELQSWGLFDPHLPVLEAAPAVQDQIPFDKKARFDKERRIAFLFEERC